MKNEVLRRVWPRDLAAKVDYYWARNVSKDFHNIWSYNSYNAEEITRDINLQELGGLVIICSKKLWTPLDTNMNRPYGSQVDLAFGDIARVTDTELLWKAANEQTGSDSEITQQLYRRMQDTKDHDAIETWIIPLKSLQVVSREVSTDI